MRHVVPGMALAGALALCALPAHAQSASATDKAVQDLLDQKLLRPADRVWLALPAGDRAASDLAVADAFGKALTAKGVAVMGNVGMAPVPTTGGFQQQLDALRTMGVTKVLSFGQTDDLGNLTVRVSEIPGGWLTAVRSVNLGATGVTSPTGTVTLGPSGVIPAERVVPWNPRHGVGLQYSALSGSGAAYRHWSESGWGVQIAGIPALSFSDNRTSGFVNLGLQGMKAFLKTDRLRLYTLLGVGALYRPNETRYTSPTASAPLTGSAWDLGLAPGLGIDYRIQDRFILTGALGYTFSRQSFASEVPTYAYSPGITLGTMIEW